MPVVCVGTLLSNDYWNSLELLDAVLCYAMLCYAKLLSLSAEELVQESDQCWQITQVEMKGLLGINLAIQILWPLLSH